jgi:hypothetical protein
MYTITFLLIHLISNFRWKSIKQGEKISKDAMKLHRIFLAQTSERYRPDKGMSPIREMQNFSNLGKVLERSAKIAMTYLKETVDTRDNATANSNPPS